MYGCDATGLDIDSGTSRPTRRSSRPGSSASALSTRLTTTDRCGATARWSAAVSSGASRRPRTSTRRAMSQRLDVVCADTTRGGRVLQAGRVRPDRHRRRRTESSTAAGPRPGSRGGLQDLLDGRRSGVGPAAATWRRRRDRLEHARRAARGSRRDPGRSGPGAAGFGPVPAVPAPRRSGDRARRAGRSQTRPGCRLTAWRRIEARASRRVQHFSDAQEPQV